MKIQSLSIVVPAGNCWNNCPFCVSKQHCEKYGKSIVTPTQIPQSYVNRMAFVRDEGCNAMIFTGTSEPQQNLPFIYDVLECNQALKKPFYNISMQTTGTNLYAVDIRSLAREGITTLALSMCSFDSQRNWDIIHAPDKVRTMDIPTLIQTAKKYGMNVRACLNLTDEFAEYEPSYFFDWAKRLGVDQLTFRKLYADGDTAQAKWITEHEYPQDGLTKIANYILCYGKPIARLPFGAIQHSVNGISTVLDDNCMAKDNIEEMKYAILRPNGHLYSRWDDTGSLIF